MIVVIDYGMGNMRSILNMLKKIGVEGIISSDIEDITNAKQLILPGVGAFDSGMSNLYKFGLVDVLNQKVLEEKTPILGICLGMQLLTKRSDEGTMPGLGWINAEAIKFKFDDTAGNLKIPHMGWDVVRPHKKNTLYKDFNEEPRFYFVHSYYVKCHDCDDILTTTTHGVEFVSSFRRDNIVGVQFHPEKSHKYGMQLMKNFVMGENNEK